MLLFSELPYNLWNKAGILPIGPWVLKRALINGRLSVSPTTTIITGRIPVANGKLAAEGMEILVK